MLLRHAPREASRLLRRALGISGKTYWHRRARSAYLREVRRLVTEVAADARSILDVGSNGCAYLDWFRWAPRRVSLDLKNPYSSEAVEGIKADFLAHKFPARFDVVLCLQVLEHVPNAAMFARRLLANAQRHLIVSVPYKWPAGRCAEHVHDPVDEAKMREWFGRSPDFSKIVAERNGIERLVAHFDVSAQPNRR
jgi:SAM-dependent methyltransferase